jgi:hypothetical protein
MRTSTVALFIIATVVVILAVTLRSTDTDDHTSAVTNTLASTSSIPTSTVPPTTSESLPVGTTVCDLYEAIDTHGSVESPDLVEASGMASSRTNPGVLWSHNDSRGTATLYAFTVTGDDLGAYDIPGAFALDWEDMSAGPGPTRKDAFLYVGDIGDNFDIRGGLVTVYRVPDIDPSTLDVAFPESTPLTYRYPKGNHNAEALFVDPVEPAMYLITKGTEEAFVFKGSIEPSNGPIDLEQVSTLFLGAEVSAADMSSDGSTLVVRGYQTVWMWHRNSTTSIQDMLSAEPCTAPSPDERQGEAITLDAELSYLTISEGLHPPIHFVGRLP